MKEKQKNEAKRRSWIKWAVGTFIVLGIIGQFLPPKEESDSVTPTFVEEVAAAPTNTIATTRIPTLARSTATNTHTPTVAPTFTPIPPSATPLLTNTPVPTIPTNTFTPVPASPTPTRIVPSHTPTVAATPIPATTTYYINSTGIVNARPCPHLNDECAPIVELNRGDEIQVIGTEPGDRFNNSETWYQVLWNGGLIYVHSYFISATRPAAIQQPSGGGSTGGQQPVSTPAVPLPTAPQTQWSCSGNIYNCGDFSTCTEVMSYFNACPGDPSDLDGNENGIPCEALCGG